MKVDHLGSLSLPETDLLPHQQQVLLMDPHRFKVLVWHRRARKTSTALNELVKQAHLKIGVYWIVFPTYREAKDSIWKDPQMLFRVIPESLIARKNEQELTLYLHCGSVIILKGADDPDSLRGSGPLGIILDEFATMKFETWGVIEPILRANGGWAWFIGTPKGKNHFYDLYLRGLQGHHEWKSYHLKASNSGIIAQDQLEEAKKSMSQALFNQEWECEFLEGEGSVFRGVREVANATPKKPEPGHNYVLGVDLAKVTDFTVISVFDRATNRQVYQDRFQTLEWPFQRQKIKAVADHYNRALVMLDATGIGDPIADDLTRAGVAVEPVKITEQIKKDLIEKLSIYIEHKRVRLLLVEDSLFEYDNFSYEIGPTGKIRYGGRTGCHDDIVLSHALAVYSLQPVITKEDDRPKTMIQQLYQDLKDGPREKHYEKEWSEWGEI
jgi:hypothetical protein